ncbi:MAG: hypothetical protein ACQEP7_05330 [bacterium]
MKDTRLLSAEQIAALVDCSRERVENWLENNENELLQWEDGRRGVDPIRLCEYLAKK